MTTEFRIDRPHALTDRQLYLLRHALGANCKNKGIWGHRNHFMCARETSNHNNWQCMVAAGFAEEAFDPTFRLFRATKVGAKAAGLHRAAIKRAFQE